MLPRNRLFCEFMNDILARITFSCSFTRALLIEEDEPKTSLNTVGVENGVFKIKGFHDFFRGKKNQHTMKKKFYEY